MPILALADIAIVVLALILLLALVLFRKAFVSVIPDFHIPLVGNLRDKVNSAFTAAIHGIWGFCDAAIGDLGKVIMLTVHSDRQALAAALGRSSGATGVREAPRGRGTRRGLRVQAPAKDRGVDHLPRFGEARPRARVHRGPPVR